MKKIELEAHFLTREYLKFLRARKDYPIVETIENEKHQKFDRIWYGPGLCQTRSLEVIDRLLNLGDGRLRAIEAAGIDIEVLSLVDPGCEQFDSAEATVLARKINDELSEVIKRYPEKFVGLATLAPQDPAGAADELERTVSELGFRGAKINSNIRGEYLDDQKYWVILERAEKFGVPINLHPTIPSPSMVKPYAASYGYYLAGPCLGFAAETALHAMRLIYSGVFDKYPDLKIILGHGGEGLPYWLTRIDESWLQPIMPGEPRPRCLKKPSEYIKTNFVATTSGVFFQPTLLCTYLALGADNMAFAADSPFQGEPGSQFIDSMPICDQDKEKIYHQTAEKLLKLG